MSDRHLSYTQIDMMSRCGQAWYFRYVQKIKRPPPSVKQLIGRGVDASVTENLRHKRDDGAPLDLAEAQQAARDSMVYEWSQSGVLLEPEEQEDGVVRVKGRAIDATVELASAHHEIVAPQIEPTWVQRKFEIELEGYDCNLVGVIDVQEERATGDPEARRRDEDTMLTQWAKGEVRPSRALDTKTTRKAKNQNDVDTSSQLTTYHMAIGVLDGSPPDEVALDVLVDKSHLKTPKPPKVQRLTSTRTEEDTAALLARVERAVTVMDSGIVTPADPGSWYCSKKWCAYHPICPFVSQRSFAT